MADWVSRFSNEIARDVPAFRHERVKSSAKSGLPEGNWFYFEITPVSGHSERVTQVLSDLLNAYPLFEIGWKGCVLPDETEALRECVLSDRDRDILRFVAQDVQCCHVGGSPISEAHEFLNYCFCSVTGNKPCYISIPSLPNPIVRAMESTYRKHFVMSQIMRKWVWINMNAS